MGDLHLRRLIFFLLVASSWTCSRRRDEFPGSSIFLVSIDTLRSDHLPVYGYKGVDTPHLDALAADSIVFERAYAHVPLTLPSHTTLFTGLLPAQNGVRDNVAYSLAPSHETLASFFRSHGYATGGAVSAIVLSHESGIARGFDFYEDSIEPTRIRESLGRVQRAGSETESKLIEWIDGEKRRPLLAFLHLYEPHSPYEPPEPFASRYRERPYDGEIAASDAIIGTFVAALKSRGLYDSSIVVLLSDHGEGLGDHGEAEHGIFLYREAIQVPLWIKLPHARRRGQKVDAPVGLTDLFPTLAELAGQPPPQKLSGVSLIDAVDGKQLPDRPIFSESFYARFHLGWSDLASLVTRQYQYIDAPRAELYDVAAEPAEKMDIASKEPAVFRQLHASLSRLKGPKPQPGEDQAKGDPERARKLAALGYLTARSPESPSADLPDPKDRIGDLSALKEAYALFSKGAYAAAASRLATLVRERPAMADAWEMYAQALHRLGHDDEALAAYLRGDSLTPGNAHLLSEIAVFSLEAGRLPEAKRYAALAQAAGAPNLHQMLAQIAVAEHDLATAEIQARAALAENAGRRVPQLILARVCKERGDLSGALAYLDQIARLTREKGLPTLSLENGLRGDVLARLGKTAEAEAALREELRLFPENPQAWCNLALLYASQGRDREARQTLADSLRAAPGADNFHAAIQTARILGDGRLASLFAAEAERRFGRSFNGGRDSPEGIETMKARRIAAQAVMPALALAIASSSCRKPPAISHRSARDVVLVTIDTLRYDAVGFDGNARGTTPNLDALAARGRVFTDAHAHNVLTLPSHTNILTGLYPYQHGVRDNVGFRLERSVDTAATVLSARGFATGAFVSAFVLDSRYGLSRGFEVYDELYRQVDVPLEWEIEQSRGQDVVTAALAWFRASAGRPRFLWIHLYDPHAPYDPPEPFRQRFADDPYLGEVAYADAALAPLLEAVRQTQPAPLLVVTADHGEARGDHGELTHGLFAYEPTLHVPLLVWCPDLVAAGRDDSPARHVDILATIADAVGAKPANAITGVSLLGSRSSPERDSYFESLSASFNRGWAPLRGLLRDRRKYIDLPIPELYDLRSDPGETNNIAPSQSDSLRTLRQALLQIPTGPVEPGPVSSGVAAKLKSLGYLSGSSALKEAYGPEDDPKNRIAVDRQLHEFVSLVESGDRDSALRLARDIVASNPRMRLGYEHLAFLLRDRGDLKGAVRVLEQARANGVARESLDCQRALLLSEIGRAPEAVAALLPYRESVDTETLNALGIALSDAGRGAEALAAFSRVEEIDPGNGLAYQNAGIALLKLDRAGEARESLQKALAIHDRNPRAWNALGVAQMRLNAPARAIEAWTKALAYNPKQYDALYNIGLVSARLGDIQRAREAFERFIATAPPAQYGRDIAQVRAALAALEKAR